MVKVKKYIFFINENQIVDFYEENGKYYVIDNANNKLEIEESDYVKLGGKI